MKPTSPNHLQKNKHLSHSTAWLCQSWMCKFCAWKVRTEPVSRGSPSSLTGNTNRALSLTMQKLELSKIHVFFEFLKQALNVLLIFYCLKTSSIHVFWLIVFLIFNLGSVLVGLPGWSYTLETALSSSNWCLSPLEAWPTPFWALLMYWAICLLILAALMLDRTCLTSCVVTGNRPAVGCYCSILRILHEQDCLTLVNLPGCVPPFSSWFIWAARHSWIVVSYLASSCWSCQGLVLSISSSLRISLGFLPVVIYTTLHTVSHSLMFISYANSLCLPGSYKTSSKTKDIMPLSLFECAPIPFSLSS